MNPLLTLEHVGFAYHQAEGETPGSFRYFFYT